MRKGVWFRKKVELGIRFNYLATNLRQYPLINNAAQLIFKRALATYAETKQTRPSQQPIELLDQDTRDAMNI